MSDYETAAHAPYNFVPFSEQVILRYQNAEELPRHDRIEPGLKTGEIHITITSETPVLVAFQKVEGESRFCRGGNGRYILPGSTIRGMTRANIQILGFGAVIPREDMRNFSFQQHYLSEGVPARHRELGKLEFPMDYPRVMLGYAGNGKKMAYRSRIAFEDFSVKGKEPLPESPVRTVAGQPRPGWHPGYVVDGKDYSENDFRLRGYKKYWMKESVSGTHPGGPRVTVTYRPLPAGTVFQGKIRYKNLHEDELGLLLWALRLEENWENEPCYQNIGMGKPYGYGRIRLKIDELLEFDMEKLYSFEGLSLGAEKAGRNIGAVVSSYVEAYQKYALAWLKKDCEKRPSGDKRQEYQSLSEYPEIRDFFFLHCVQNDFNTSYMRRWEYENAYTPLPDTASLRTEWEERRKEEEQEELLQGERTMDELLAELKNRFQKV